MAKEPPETHPLLQACTNCASLLDITEQEPFSHVHCPICGTLMRARTQFNNFTLQQQIGAGGMGAVYKALDVNLNRMVALKVVRKEYSSDPAYLEKFEYEARITASINHPHVVKVFSFGSDHGLFYIVMELVDKGSLDDLINLQGRVAEAQVLEVGIQMAQGLQAAFAKGLIHRDVKPGNILFADSHTAKIVDFGLALLMEQAAEARGEVWGTPYYVAPEKLNNEQEDFRSDIYSLGGTLFHALAGRPPFEAESASLVALKHLKSKAVSLQAFAPDISSSTAYVINRTLQKDPNQRYQSYDEFIEHLSYARNKLAETANKPRQPKARVVVESKTQQNAMAWINLALVATILIAGLAVFFFRDRIFKKNEDAAEVEQTPKATADATDEEGKYQEARRQMRDGNYSGALDALHKLDARQNLPQPLGRWITLHEGLSSLLDGSVDDARGIFKKLKNAGMYSTDPKALALANLFVDLGSKLSEQKSLPKTIVKYYDPKTCEALSLFVFAVFDWQMSDFDDAGPLFYAFLASTPQEPFAWISEYKPIAKKYAADYAAYQPVADKIKAADTAQKKNEALKELRMLKGSLRVPGKLSEKLNELETELQQKAITEQRIEWESQSRQVAMRREKDASAIAAVKTGMASLNTGYQFETALDTIQKTTVFDPDSEREKSVLLKKEQWLVKFKTTLISDINASGYPQPVSKRNSAPIAGGVHKATTAQIEIQTPYGIVPVLWSEMTPAMILAMADYFSKKNSAPGTSADRAWLAGAFAMQAGMKKEGEKLLLQASQEKADYGNELPLFIEVAKR